MDRLGNMNCPFFVRKLAFEVFDKDLYEVSICYDAMLGVASEHECKVRIFIFFFIFRFDARRDDLVNLMISHGLNSNREKGSISTTKEPR